VTRLAEVSVVELKKCPRVKDRCHCRSSACAGHAKRFESLLQALYSSEDCPQPPGAALNKERTD